jgi:hypothetical protein
MDWGELFERGGGAVKPWPKDEKFRRFAALVADAAMAAKRRGIEIDPGEHGNCCCPLGAVCLMVNDISWMLVGAPLFPTCDTSSDSVAEKLGKCDEGWIDECRAFEVGFDGDNPREECVSKRDPYYLLGCAYREKFA